ncbi:MAG: polymerase most-like protein containing domain hydrolase domain and Zn-ribbon domain [Proteobacteria bacterium]|nr:polymerase most-like protein containing domain hydrolase domain and Zn-ribbon domain [Pseudomonadota bacterium]
MNSAPTMPPSPPAAGDQACAIGNLADLQEGEIALPSFISQRPDGLYVDLAEATQNDQFFAFVERSFAIGTFFSQLDYPPFIALLFDDPASLGGRYPPTLRFAGNILSFAPERQALYRQLKVDNGEAVYLFEPAYLETVVDEPIMGDLEDGSFGLLRVEQRTLNERTSLDVDEFIAAAWLQDIRYGIDYAAVAQAIQSGKTERLVVARPRPFIPGKDAEIKPESSNLQRSNAPKRLSGGRIDLTQFENRHPQVTKDLRLFKKFPRQPGEDGLEISGKPIPAPLPADLDLSHCAGPGTQIVNEADGECLITTAAGFLNIDAASGLISITAKIVSREGVSLRTTGDLQLAGEEYEEFGEIQEKRTVKCHSITVHGDVFGNIVSQGGEVLLKHNLVGGSASNAAGDISVEGVCSGATLLAPAGCLHLKKAENCLLIGREVHIDQARCCDILADRIVIANAESCAIAGHQVEVVQARNAREVENVFSLLVPDLSAFHAKRNHLHEEEARLKTALEEQQRKIDSIRQQKEISHYLKIASKLQRKELTLAPEQQEGWKKLATQVAPALRALRLLSDSGHALQANIEDVHSQLAALDSAEQEAGVGVACTVGQIVGETRIRSLTVKLDAPPLAQLPAKELRLRLRATDNASRPLFSGDSGQFAWQYAKTQVNAELNHPPEPPA